MSQIEDKSGDQHIGADHQLSAPHSGSGKSWIAWVILLLAVAGFVIYILQGGARARARSRRQAPAEKAQAEDVA